MIFTHTASTTHLVTSRLWYHMERSSFKILAANHYFLYLWLSFSSVQTTIIFDFYETLNYWHFNFVGLFCFPPPPHNHDMVPSSHLSPILNHFWFYDLDCYPRGPLGSCLSLTFPVNSIRICFQFYFQNISKILLLLTTSFAIVLFQDCLILYLSYFNGL